MAIRKLRTKRCTRDRRGIIPLPPDDIDHVEFNTYEYEVSKEMAWEIAKNELLFTEDSFKRMWKPEMEILIAWIAEHPRIPNGRRRICGDVEYLSLNYAPYRLMCAWEWWDRRIKFTFEIAEYVEI